jgi:aromatic ring-opening dioxygenase catalytic subunit (LigB family)
MNSPKTSKRDLPYQYLGNEKPRDAIAKAATEKGVLARAHHVAAMPMGDLGWDTYERGVEIVTPYFESSGTGQVNAVFPV